MSILPHYALLDSGEGARLEQFGERRLIRPSTIAVWRRRLPPAEWAKADATWEPDAGWQYRGESFPEWRLTGSEVTLLLRPQNNGQIGLFPEHASYLGEVAAAVAHAAERLGRAPRLLNLFAYTGMASIVAARAGADVTHVDMMKRALDWARANLEVNGLSGVRLIPEDALAFLDREGRRGNRYDLIIADPPSFSRLNDKRSWQLDEVIVALIGAMWKVLDPAGSLFLTSHQFELGAYTLRNLLIDLDPACAGSVHISALTIPEQHSTRELPCGHLVRLLR